MMDEREFQEALREIEGLPDTDGGGIGSSRQGRKERLEFCYKRRDMFIELLSKTEIALKDVLGDIERLTKEESAELAEGPREPSPRRRANDVLIDSEQC